MRLGAAAQRPAAPCAGCERSRRRSAGREHWSWLRPERDRSGEKTGASSALCVCSCERRWRRGGTRVGSLPNLRAWAGLRRAWSQAVAPASLGAAGCVGRGGPRRRSVAGSRLRNGRGAAGLFASLSPARKAPRAQLEREAVRSAGTPGASCASRRRARDVEAVRRSRGAGKAACSKSPP